jgi:class 3 adenylate cyclase
MPPVPSPASETRQPLSIVFTDLVGSSEYFARQGDAAGMALVARHNELLFPVVTSAGGRVIKTIGDSIMATFENLGQAVRAAWAMQQTLANANISARENEQIRIRIGVHYGLVYEKDGDVFGDAVNMAARVEAMAGAGQILVSRVVHDLLRADPYVKVRSVGPMELKGSPEPIELFELIAAPAPQPGAAVGRRRRTWSIALSSVALLAVAYLGWHGLRARRWTGLPPTEKIPAVEQIAGISLRHWVGKSPSSEVRPDKAIFLSGEQFEIIYRFLRPHYLYAAFYDAQRQSFTLVFPEADTLEPAHAGDVLRIPPDARFTLDNQPRTEIILLIVSAAPVETLEGLSHFGNATDPKLWSLLQQIKAQSLQAQLAPDVDPMMLVESPLGSRPSWLELRIEHH